MPSLATPPTLAAAHLHARVGISYLVFAVIAVLHALVAQWMWSTVGVPHRAAAEQNERIQATNELHTGLSERNLLRLQAGLTRAVEIDAFNDTLFDDAKLLHRGLRKRLDALQVAVEGGQAPPLMAALEAAIEPHSDGLPIVDRHHLRTAAKRLHELNKKATERAADAKGAASEGRLDAAAIDALLGRVRGAIDRSRGNEDGSSNERQRRSVR